MKGSRKYESTFSRGGRVQRTGFERRVEVKCPRRETSAHASKRPGGSATELVGKRKELLFGALELQGRRGYEPPLGEGINDVKTWGGRDARRRLLAVKRRRAVSARSKTAQQERAKEDILGALDLGTARLVVLVHGIVASAAGPCPALVGVDHLDVLVDVDLLGELGKRGPGREDRLERAEELRVELVGEPDVDLDDEVAHVVVAVRGHALAGNNFDGGCGRGEEQKSVVERCERRKGREAHKA